MRFNVGDKVTVTPGSLWSALLGNGVGVVRAHGSSGWTQGFAVHFPVVGEIFVNGSDLLSATRPCIVAVIGALGSPVPAVRPYVHDSRALATKEAERLAVANPGKEFVVYEAVAKSVAQRPVVATVGV